MEVDRIERTMTLDVPREDVWAALTEPDRINKWFGDSAELDLRPGGEGVFRWGEITIRVVVEEVDPPRRFSYRWEPSHVQDGGPTTLVEFTLDEVDGGTRLQLVESGFAALSDDSHAANSEGWDSELAELREHLAARVGA